MNATHSNATVTAETAPAPVLTKVGRAEKTIAKLNERQAKLDAEKQKATQALVNAQRSETMEAGQKEFVRAVETLDPSTREAVISQVLQSLKDGPRLAKIQAWVALIPPPESRADPAKDRAQAEETSEEELPSTTPHSTS